MNKRRARYRENKLTPISSQHFRLVVPGGVLVVVDDGGRDGAEASWPAGDRRRLQEGGGREVGEALRDPHTRGQDSKHADCGD